MTTGDEQTRLICSDILVNTISKFQTFSSGDIILEEIWNSSELISIYNIEVNTEIPRIA
jgi:hypothetical protein